jgi:hypothetical protein
MMSVLEDITMGLLAKFLSTELLEKLLQKSGRFSTEFVVMPPSSYHSRFSTVQVWIRSDTPLPVLKKENLPQ